MPLIPAGEFRPDVTDYLGTASRNVLNVVPRGDGYGPFPGPIDYSQALPSACRGGFYALKSDGSIATFAGTSNKLYLLNNTTLGWTDVSLSGGTYGTLASNAQWQFVQFGNLVFATQANAVLQVYDLSTPTTFTNCAGSPPQAAYISVVGRFLVLSGLLSTPFRIQWSGLNATTTWTSGVNSSDFQDLPDGGIVRGVAGGEFGTIFQDQAIRRMSYLPGSALIFQIERVAQDKGLFAPYSIVRAGEVIFFYSTQGFHKILPGGVPQQIGREKIDRTFFDQLDKNNLQMFIGSSDPRSSRVFWAYKTNAAPAGTYDRILVYDYILERFTPLSVNGEYLLGLSQPGVTLEGLDSISASLDALVSSLDSFAVSTQPLIAQFSTAHKMGFFYGPNLEATVESAEQGTDGNRIFIRGFRPITDAQSVFGSISYRETQQATSTASAETIVNTRTGRCDLRRSTRYARFKARIPSGTTWSFMAGVEPDLVAEGQL